LHPGAASTTRRRKEQDVMENRGLDQPRADTSRTHLLFGCGHWLHWLNCSEKLSSRIIGDGGYGQMRISSLVYE
jgi:hypothetical protein